MGYSIWIRKTRAATARQHSLVMADLLVLAINLTRRCNLDCAHCYLDANTLHGGGASELTTDEVHRLLRDVVECGGSTMVVLTGGEPLLRNDLEEVVSFGAGLGLAMVVGTNGMALTRRRVEALKNAGLLGAGISIDSLDAGKHDRFRGRNGAWARTMAGVEQCRRQGLSFQLHFSVTGQNEGELAQVVEFADMSGARVLNVFFLVCTGRGSTFTDITPGRYEQMLNELVQAQERYPGLLIRPRCAPYYKRIAYEREPRSLLNRISGQDGDGCIAGTRYCRVTPEGAVTACPYIEQEVGNIRQHSFKRIWDTAEQFQQLRNPALTGKCGICEYRKICGGCRARPVAAGRDLLDADLWCVHEPAGDAVIEPLVDTARLGICWSDAAESRLARVPPFLRKMIRKRAEAYVAELGAREVTVGHLDTLTARRFGRNSPRRPGL